MRTHVFLIVLAAMVLTSCSEIVEPAAKAQAGVDGTSAEECAEPPCEQKPSWWASARSVSSDSLNSEIVSCQVGRTTSFSTRSACLSRGGVPQ